MPRIRSIKPDFWASEKVARRLPGPDGRQARLLFIGLWNFCEDHGVARGGTPLVRAEVFPYDEDVTNADVDRWLELLERGHFITRFRVDGQSFVYVNGFREHQRINRPSGTSFPMPPGGLTEDSLSPHGGLKQVPEPMFAGREGKGMEGSGREGRGEETPPPPVSKPAQPSDLEQRLAEAFQAERGRPYRWGHGDMEALRQLLAEGVDPLDIVASLRRGLKRTAYPRINSVADMGKHWNACAQDEPTRPKDIRKGHVRAEDMQHSAVVGEVKF